MVRENLETVEANIRKACAKIFQRICFRQETCSPPLLLKAVYYIKIILSYINVINKVSFLYKLVVNKPFSQVRG